MPVYKDCEISRAIQQYINQEFYKEMKGSRIVKISIESSSDKNDPTYRVYCEQTSFTRSSSPNFSFRVKLSQLERYLKK
ncbi:MAG: hypothetical protein QW156_00150 [Candidatus Aenigmatarchaeota archaeon]